MISKAIITLILTLAGICLCIALALLMYAKSIPNCIDTAASRSELPIYPLLLEIGESNVTVTGKKKLGIGQTFVVGGDGRWFSNTTLLTTNNNEAVFLLEYYDYERERSSSCIWHASKEETNR